MKLALSAKFKLGFIDGTYVKPVVDSPLLAHWTRYIIMVISWILNSVSTDIRNSIVYMSYACAIWNDLAVRYALSNLVIR